MDHLFFDHLKSVFYQFNIMLTFTILLDGIFYTHKMDASNDDLFLSSFSFFSSSRLSPTATARLRDEWWVDSLFLLLWLPRRDFCSLFLLLWLSFRNFRWIFREERLGRKDIWKLKLAAATFEPLILITFHHWKLDL